MKPLLKWPGGKTQLLDVLRPLIDSRRNYGGTLFEPFLGAGAVALSMDEDVAVVASDVCGDLMDFYLAVRTSPARVSSILEGLRERHSESHYYAVRSSIGASLAERAARFIYLSKMGFNGLYRVNKAGQFNVPIGRGKVTALPTYGELVELSTRVRHSWRLEHADFEEVLGCAVEGDVIFADPPYHGTFGYSSGFGDDDQARLSACLRRAARRGVGVVATNSDTPLTRNLYRWADVRDLSERRRIAAAGDRRGDAACVVAVRP
jgi:DNA adenine methylase